MTYQVVSLFAGIGGFDRAAEQSGMQVVVAVEIDPVCRSVLKERFPGVVILNDVREVTGDQLRALGVDPDRCVLTFGWPCQDLSIAGRRAGLGGTRSGLFWEAVRVARELRPRWIVAENVPGLLSAVCTCPGDHTCVRHGRSVSCGEWRGKGRRRRFAAHVLHTPPGGACPGGCMARHGGAMGTVLGAVAELGYGFAYRVLDAQFTGVPQRRRRVFIVGCLGDWTASSRVLLEPDRVRGSFAAGAEPGARVAGTLAAAAGSGGLGGLGMSDAAITSRLVETVSTVQGGGQRGYRIDAEAAAGGHLLPIAFDMAQITSDVNRVNPQPGDPAPPLAATGQPMVAGTLRSHPRPGSNSNGAVVPVALRGRGEGNRLEAGAPGAPAFAVRGPGGGSSYPMVAHPVTTSMGRLDGTVETMVAFANHHRVETSENVAQPVTGSNRQPGGVAVAGAVRRLTPGECDRLQGFPLGWTLVRHRGRMTSNAARYRMVGNAVAVTCVRWITDRIAAVERGEL